MDTPPKAGERTLDEVKKEVLRRAGQHSPFEGVRKIDVEKIVGGLTSLDKDHWAERWSAVGLDYEGKADALAKQGGAGKDIADIYMLAFNYCSLGRYPAATTPGKKEAYRHSLRIFRKAAKYFDPPLQVAEYPCDELKLTGYLQVPKGVAKPPVVMHWGGVDMWKENRQHANAVLHGLGLATFTVDMPGVGEHPLKFTDPRAERTYSAAIDYLLSRTNIDGSRIGVWGGSFGGYWAARLAYKEAKRVKAAVFHGSNVHYGFQREWLTPALTKTASTYLFGPASLFEARSSAMGVKTLEEFLEAAPKLSLKDMGLLDQPSAAILGVNGKLDDQAPVQDIYLLMEHGSPKEARIYPEGGHMGRTPGRDASEITETICAWLKSRI
ncbi:MAG TPA: alpha/beta fold hydrolase [Burkholderiales bacterium]|nr:alpha/beta fold hydrolase [Burkholderiales bacterium]